MTDKYNFQVGEKVIDVYGRKGTIVHTCHCEECEKRGFYEFVIKWYHAQDREDWVTCYDEKNGFTDLHKVGKRTFNPLNLEKATDERKVIEKQIAELQEQKRYLSNGINLIKAVNRLKRISDEN